MLDNESNDPTYLAQTRPGTTDHYGRIIPRGWLRALQLDLTVASAAGGVEKKLSGDFLFLDRNTSGVITVQLNDPTEYAIPMGQFDMLEGIPIDRVILSWAAQPGLKANIWYGYQARLKATAGVSDISDRAGRVLGLVYGSTGNSLLQQRIDAGNALVGASNLLVTRDLGFSYATSFISSTGLTANTPENVIAAASNLNGYMLFDGQIFSGNGTAVTLAAMTAKATAPANTSDGEVLSLSAGAVAFTSTFATWVRLLRSVFVSSGKRLDSITSVTETSAHRQYKYTLY